MAKLMKVFSMTEKESPRNHCRLGVNEEITAVAVDDGKFLVVKWKDEDGTHTRTWPLWNVLRWSIHEVDNPRERK